jgi:transcription elongation factor S-II
MDERELAQRVKALSKAVMGNEPASSILSLMETLKKDASPTEEMLRVSNPMRHNAPSSQP